MSPLRVASRGDDDLAQIAAAGRAMAQLKAAVRDRSKRERKPKAPKPKAKALARAVVPLAARAQPSFNNAAFFQNLGHNMWFIACSESYWHDNYNVMGLFVLR